MNFSGEGLGVLGYCLAWNLGLAEGRAWALGGILGISATGCA